MNEIEELNSDEEVASAAAICVILSGEVLKMRNNQPQKRWWMSSFNKSRKRFNTSNTLGDLSKQPSSRFENFCRMSATDFEYLLSRIGPCVARQDTNMKNSIPVQERLAVALRFFATGESYSSLSQLFKFSKQTVSRCVDDVCHAIKQELQEEVESPKTEDEWLKIAQRYENHWNFPNCLGAMECKHVAAVQSPMSSSSTDLLTSRGGDLSVVLFAVVDADYCFTVVDIGSQDRTKDVGVFNDSSWFSKLQKGELKLPSERKIPPSDKMLPYVFVGDTAFALSRHVMTPYSSIPKRGSTQKAFDYRLARAHRVVENVFGVMASVFRVFRKPMVLQPDKVSDITLSCVLLHNFLRRSPLSASHYTPPGTFDTEADGEVVEGSWRSDRSKMTSFVSLKRTARKPGEGAEAIRKTFAEYFTTSGKLSWQDKYC